MITRKMRQFSLQANLSYPKPPSDHNKYDTKTKEKDLN